MSFKSYAPVQPRLVVCKRGLKAGKSYGLHLQLSQGLPSGLKSLLSLERLLSQIPSGSLSPSVIARQEAGMVKDALDALEGNPANLQLE